MEVLLALSLTVALVALILGGVASFTRHGVAGSALEALNLTARSLEEQLHRDLASVSRLRTFTSSGSCPGAVPGAPSGSSSVRLWLVDQVDGSPYYVDYVFQPASRALRRTPDVNGPASAARTFGDVVSFHVGCLQSGVVVATAVLRERVDGAAPGVGQQVEVRVASEVRMR